MSKGTLIVTEMLICVVSFILELWHHCGATPNAKHALNACGQMGSQEKVAIVAVANKLIRQAFAVVTQEKIYIDGYKSVKP